MAATPVDEHTDEFEQLAGLSALRVLEGEDLARFERHAAQCERCRLMVQLDREAVARLSLSAPEMDPSPGFKSRLMQRAADELERTAALTPAEAQTPAEAPAPPPPTPMQPRPPNVVPLRRRSAWVSALAAVLVLGIVSASVYRYMNEVVATYPLSGSVPGSAAVVVHRSGGAELELHGLPDPEPGFLYEAWVIPEGKQPIAAGTTTRGEANLPLPGDVRNTTVALTRERSVVKAPTGDPFLATVVRES